MALKVHFFPPETNYGGFCRKNRLFLDNIKELL